MDLLNQHVSFLPSFGFSGKLIIFIVIIIVVAGLAFTVRNKNDKDDGKDV